MKYKIFLSLLAIAFCSISSAQFEICIHAKIHDGMRDAVLNGNQPEVGKTHRLAYRLMGDRITGHASLELRNNGETFRSYGYWPDDNLQINSDHMDKSSTGANEYNGVTINSRVASSCYPVSFSQIEEIERLAKVYQQRYGDWTSWHNCVRFAARVFEQTTGIDLNTNLPLPRSLYGAIASRPNHVLYDSSQSEVGEASGEADIAQ